MADTASAKAYKTLTVGRKLASAVAAAAALWMSPQSVSAVPPVPPVDREFRASWLCTVSNLDWPTAASNTTAKKQSDMLILLDAAQQLKLNAVLFQVRPACDAFYTPPATPWAEPYSQWLNSPQGTTPNPFFDPLDFVITEARKRNLEVHAWINPYRASTDLTTSTKAPNHITRRRPDLCRAYDGKYLLDPGMADSRTQVINVVTDLVSRYDIDALVMDDYFYPYPDANNTPFPDTTSYAAYTATTSSPLSLANWRRNNVDTLIQEINNAVHTTKPWVRYGISPFGIWRPGNPSGVTGLDAYNTIYADSRKWLQQGWVDYLSPQLYWPTYSTGQPYGALCAWWSNSTQNPLGRHVWPSLNTSNIVANPTGNQITAAELALQVTTTRATAGATGNIHFRTKALSGNQQGVKTLLQGGAYAQPALPPATTWRDSTPPPSPSTSSAVSGANRIINWQAASGSEPIRGWVLQTCRGDVWSTVFLPAATLTSTISETGLQAYAISGYDRVNNQSAPTLVILDGGTIDISGNSQVITPGDTTPSSADGTDSGAQVIGSQVTNTFTITNTGTAEITFPNAPSVSGTNVADFAITFDTSPLAIGASRTFTVRFQPNARGTRSATISIFSTAAVSPYSFDVRGSGLLSGALTVEGNSTTIVSGDTTPNSADGTDFGSANVGSSQDRTFTLRNTGDTPLSIAAPTFTGAAAAEFSLPTPPPATLAGGASANITVRFSPTNTGYRLATLNINTGSTYQFAVAGAGLSSGDLRIYGAGFVIPVDSSFAFIDNLTDFGQITQVTTSDNSPAHTFVGKNEGTGPLTVTSIVSPSSNFIVATTATLPFTVPAGGYFTFDVRPVATTVGTISTTLAVGSDDPDTGSYNFQVRANVIAAPTSSPLKEDPITTTVSWQELGIPDSALPILGNPVGLGSRGYDAGNTSLLMTLTTNTQTRVVGWREDAATDIPYASIGTDKVARASFAIYSVAAPGINALPTTSTVFSLPNFRIRLMQRFVINSMLEVNHNSGNTDPAVRNLAREFSPSNDPAAPSVYTVDLDPVDIPYLLGSAGVTEGVQRGVEAVGEVSPLLPDYQYVQGTLALTDSSVGTYPIPNRAQTPVKVYATGTTDFTNSDVTLTKLQLDHDPLASGIVSGLSLETSLTLTKSTAGITVDSTLVPASKVAIAAVDFLGGNGYDQTHPESRLRIDPERLYKISFRISSTGLTTSAPQIRLRARTAKFQWTHKLELGGAAAVGSAAGRAIIAEAMPGTNSQNLDSDANGQWYHVWFTSPLQPNVRADVPSTMLDKFPLLMAQPGNGDPTNQSVRDLKLGFDVIDTLSFGVGYEGEVAKDINLNRIEIRDYPQPDMTVAP